MSMNMHERQRGFTLIELMVVVAIVAILAAIAVPAYQSSVMKSKRSDAMVALSRAVALQEKYFALNNAYLEDADPFAAGDTTIASPEGLYLITVALPEEGVGYTVTATAEGAQAEDSCDGFSINQAGRKGVTEGEVADCW